MSELRSIVVAPTLLAQVLAPYRVNCRYVQRALVEVPDAADPDGDLVRIRGELGIAESCYIDDTGHFNSVEFNLAYNQLVYTLMAQCVVDRLLPAFAAMTFDEYLERQLPDVLIHDFSSKFRRAMEPRAFRGTVAITRATKRGAFSLLQTRCAFEDDNGGSCDGQVTLAIVDRRTARALDLRVDREHST